MKKALVIGGGFAGCSGAQMLKKKGFEVYLVEALPYLGGGCRTFHHFGHPYTYGPRHFLTTKPKIFEFLNQFVPMRKIPEHEFLTYVGSDKQFYNFPIHEDDIERMPDREQIKKELADQQDVDGSQNLEEFWVRSVGPTLYSKYVEKYSKKMWMIDSNRELDVFNYTAKGVALKTGSKACWEGAISAFPLASDGYDAYFPLATQGCHVRLNTRISKFDIPNYKVEINGIWEKYDVLLNTISPEYLFDQCYGPLRWMGRDFLKIILPVEEVFPKNIYFLYYANDEPFTRIVEYKKFYRNRSPHSLLGLEIPSTKNKLYPFTTKKDQDLAAKYQALLPERAFSLGRAAEYRYIDVAIILDHMFDLEKQI